MLTSLFQFRKSSFTDNTADQQKSESDTKWKIQVQVTGYREQVAISNMVKYGTAGVNALAFQLCKY